MADKRHEPGGVRWEWEAAFESGVWRGAKRQRVEAPSRVKGIKAGAAQCRGRRPYQEDRVVALQSFQVRATEDAGPSGCDSAVQRSYFGIFDGHSGEEVAALAAGRMHSILAQSLGSKSAASQRADRGERVGRSLRQSFLKLDREIWNWSIEKWDERHLGGSCALVAYREGEDLYVANAGDCRAVICLDGRAIPLSRDHKPDTPGEQERLAAVQAPIARSRSTAYIVSPVCTSGLAVSRCLGDVHFKQLGYLIADPDVHRTRLCTGHRFLVLACDGVWDVMTNQEAVNIVREFLKNVEITDKAMEAAAVKLIEKAMMRGSGDNMSTIVAWFDWGT